ncbi:MAG: arginine--tRNA ligase [Acidobacteriota bacterium]
MLTVLTRWQTALAREILDRFGVDIAPLDVPFSFPPKPEMGDAATPVAFALAKMLKRPPQQIAAELSGVELEGVARIHQAGPYLNLFLDRAWALEQFLKGRFVPAGEPGKVIVEHTNINPNKAAHVGHLRNAVLGDTLVRCLRYLGRRVEVQNYIDDTGVQVADVVVGFQRVKTLPLEEVKALAGELGAFEPELGTPFFQEYREAWEAAMPGFLQRHPSWDCIRPELERCFGRFDAFCWELYAQVAPWYAQAEEHKQARLDTLHLMEAGGNETAETAGLIAGHMVGRHLRTMDRLGIRYDVLPHESDILQSGFWRACFEKLKASAAIHEVPRDSEDKNRGCWVMGLADSDEFKGMSDADKVIVRSNGTVTYIGKDMAYQLWKFGLLGRDFHYRPFENPLYRVWRTAPDESAPDAPSFGDGARVYNVIDVRQSYLQKIVREGLRQMGHEQEAERSIHYASEMVALATQFVRSEMEKGAKFDLDEEDLSKPFVEMSGRKGLGFQADLLLDRMRDRALEEIQSRDPDLVRREPGEWAHRASALAAGALRYYMVKYNKNQVVAFDLDQALAFEGETGPYLQYACVRAENILRKAAERAASEDGFEAPDPSDPAALREALEHLDDEAWELLTLFLRTPNQVYQAVESLDINLVAKHLFTAAQSFHNYYHRFPVLQEENVEKRRARLLTIRLFAMFLRNGLEDLLGIRVPERM